MALLTAGVDEAGRGPCAGPVVAAAVILPDSIADFSWSTQITDSKKLSSAKREFLFEHITRNCQYAIAESSVDEIDRINILQASLLAMRRAVDGLGIRPDMVLVDGNILPQWDYAARAIRLKCVFPPRAF